MSKSVRLYLWCMSWFATAILTTAIGIKWHIVFDNGASDCFWTVAAICCSFIAIIFGGFHFYAELYERTE